ncbi:hypothetical protein HQ544_02690 [Candidatus Falkowbacteria bacterium]|nr:hypothetical protein [Candidatus Falkowbacteria bacterium]
MNEHQAESINLWGVEVTNVASQFLGDKGIHSPKDILFLPHPQREKADFWREAGKKGLAQYAGLVEQIYLANDAPEGGEASVEKWGAYVDPAIETQLEAAGILHPEDCLGLTEKELKAKNLLAHQGLVSRIASIHEAGGNSAPASSADEPTPPEEEQEDTGNGEEKKFTRINDLPSSILGRAVVMIFSGRKVYNIGDAHNLGAEGLKQLLHSDHALALINEVFAKTGLTPYEWPKDKAGEHVPLQGPEASSKATDFILNAKERRARENGRGESPEEIAKKALQLRGQTSVPVEEPKPPAPAPEPEHKEVVPVPPKASKTSKPRPKVSPKEAKPETLVSDIFPGGSKTPEKLEKVDIKTVAQVHEKDTAEPGSVITALSPAGRSIQTINIALEAAGYSELVKAVSPSKMPKGRKKTTPKTTLAEIFRKDAKLPELRRKGQAEPAASPPEPPSASASASTAAQQKQSAAPEPPSASAASTPEPPEETGKETTSVSAEDKISLVSFPTGKEAEEETALHGTAAWQAAEMLAQKFDRLREKLNTIAQALADGKSGLSEDQVRELVRSQLIAFSHNDAFNSAIVKGIRVARSTLDQQLIDVVMPWMRQFGENKAAALQALESILLTHPASSIAKEVPVEREGG